MHPIYRSYAAHYLWRRLRKPMAARTLRRPCHRLLLQALLRSSFAATRLRL